MTLDWTKIALVVNSPLVSLWLIFWGFVLDRIVGDPRRIPHPVTLIGVFIAWFEALTNRGGPARRRISGFGLMLVTVAGTYALTWGFLALLTRINFWLGLVLSLWLMGTTFASKSLAQAGTEIFRLLSAGDLTGARRKLAWIVGRDTAELPTEEVVRGAVETVAENIVDGVTSPLFYALIGGAPLAMAYKAVNTLDSMVGYRNEQYHAFGWAGARLDDAANFIPARLTALILILVAMVRGLNWREALGAVRRDAPKHPSPNSGYTESAVAGALGVQLGGWNSYGGVKSFRAYMGEAKVNLAPQHILITVKLMFATGWVFLILGLAVRAFVLAALR